ncbi:hypothetical protein [Streptomyces sp. CNQ085]|uniref:hypothetical protein n=1 Tax=Streptomyces sp. CNQ085 TaxID=2886944 RepID=UPI001F51236C|nr:hypothetical protein [Streptomyces sp. CNQ085]MCI0386205.1 hypothetical protein [Streptomyces sp. CNQ085]
MSDRPLTPAELAATFEATDNVALAREERAMRAEESARREPLSAEVREQVAALIGEAKPATDGLLEQIAKSIRDRREHEHPTWEDLYCLNVTSWMGERMGPVLRRLLDAEARVAELEQHTTTARVEAIADVADWLDENGLKVAAHLVYTCDIPAARDMKVVPQQAAEGGGPA